MIKRTKSYWASLINLQLPDRQCCNMVSLFEIIRLKMKKKWATFFLQPGSSFLETLYWVILKNPTFSNINIKQHSDIYWQNIYLFLFAFSVFYICLSMCKRSLATCAAPGSFVPLEFLCQCTQANGWKRLEGISLLMCLTLSHFDRMKTKKKGYYCGTHSWESLLGVSIKRTCTGVHIKLHSDSCCFKSELLWCEWDVAAWGGTIRVGTDW